jgi:hypothetical protein
MHRLAGPLLPAVIAASLVLPVHGKCVLPPLVHGPFPDSASAHSVSFVARFAARGVTLDADTRESLFQHLDGARRFYSSPRVCARHAHVNKSLDAERLAYLDRLLALQGVALRRAPHLSCLSAAAAMPDEVEIELFRCD